MILHEIKTKLQNGSLTVEKLVGDSLKQIDATKKLNAYISVFNESALSQAKAMDGKLKRGEKLESLGRLAGMPIAIKDNIVMSEGKTTCASKILANFEGPYDATVIQKLKNEGAIIVGKTNMDEFAMGSSTENSAFGKALNPLDNNVIPGGSSGGSAIAVAADTVPVSLGSDTGGSIRQPAACCGIVGLKPTYGRISRYGLVAFASSLDQIGPFGKYVRDVAELMNVICGHDDMDQTSTFRLDEDFTSKLGEGVKGKVFGVPMEFMGEGLDPEIKKDVEAMLVKLEKEGAQIRHIRIPHMEYGVAAYYIIATAEASANLSRFDGVRYAHRTKEANNLVEMYSKTRAEGFGKEVKRRILLGTYVLSSGFYEAYYMQAQKVRRKITEDYKKAFAECDVIITPTMPEKPSTLGTYESNPMAAYLADVYTVGLNLAGLPGISVPAAKRGQLYTGIQIVGKHFGETELLQVASAIESLAKE